MALLTIPGHAAHHLSGTACSQPLPQSLDHGGLCAGRLGFLKGIFDYIGTYLVNYAGFGLVTDLRNEIYGSVLRRSAAFFQKHPTGTLVSAIINDIDKVQFAMSSVLAEFLQQFFTFVFTAALVISVGGKLAWMLLLFVPVDRIQLAQDWAAGAHTTRRGQDKLAEIQNILHETITGNRIVKAFSMEVWETTRFKAAAKRLFSANMRSVVALARELSADGPAGRGGHRAAAEAGTQQHQARHHDHRRLRCLYRRHHQSLPAGAQVRGILQQFSAGAGRFGIGLPVHGRQGRGAREAARTQLPGFRDSIRFENVRFSYS